MNENELLAHLLVSPTLHVDIRAATRTLSGYLDESKRPFVLIRDELRGFVANIAEILPFYAGEPEAGRDAAVAELATGMALRLSLRYAGILRWRTDTLESTLHTLAAQTVKAALLRIRAPEQIRTRRFGPTKRMMARARP